MASIPHKSNTPDDGGENYSVDEMMARLKKGERRKRSSSSSSNSSSDHPPERELVTRDDGTQVVKVRRRKRRSKQAPKKKTSQTNPKLKWFILGSIVVLIILLTVATIFIIAKYNGRAFKAKTESSISELSGASETVLTQLRVTPVSAQANKAEITWDQHAFIKDASFNSILAKINAVSFFSSEWIGEEVVAKKGVIHLQSPTDTIETPASNIPSPYQFGSYRCNQLTLFFGADRTSPAIHDMQVSLRELNNEQHHIVFHNGTLKVKNWPEMQLSSGILTLNSQSVDIEAQLKAKASHDAQLSIKGTLSKQTTTPAILNIKAKNYPIQELLGQNLGRLIKGNIQSDTGTFSYDYSKPTDEALSFILPFNSTDIRCEGLPMFQELNKRLGNTSYVRPLFHRCRGTIIRTSEGLAINDLEFVNNSLLILRGNIAVSSKGKLSGQLSVSVPQSSFHGEAPQPFTGPSGGFYHIDITLDGTIQTPNDNLHQLLKTSAPQKPQRPRVKIEDLVLPKKPLSENPQQPDEKDFDDLTR